MGNEVKITEAELQVMKVIWSNKKVTSSIIIDELKDKMEWKAPTIKSLINRLLKKGVIDFDKNGKEYLYYSIITEEEYIAEESTSFLNRVFNGSVNSMILNFVKSEKLSKDDIRELQEMLNKKEE